MKKPKFPNLRAEMAKHGDTCRTLAKILNTTNPAIYRRMSGLTQWSIDEVDKICEYYGKNYYELFKGE